MQVLIDGATIASVPGALYTAISRCGDIKRVRMHGSCCGLTLNKAAYALDCELLNSARLASTIGVGTEVSETIGGC